MSRYIPANIKKQLLQETQFRCASCLQSIEFLTDNSFYSFDEKAHIESYSETKDNSYENLITLCPTCHTKYDKHPDKEASQTKLKSLKKHWIVASGNYSKLEIDCLMSIYKDDNFTWVKLEKFTNASNGKTLEARSFSVPQRQSYLFRNLIKNELVTVIKQKGAFGDGNLTLGPSLPAEDTLVFILSEKGKIFCSKF